MIFWIGLEPLFPTEYYVNSLEDKLTGYHLNCSLVSTLARVTTKTSGCYQAKNRIRVFVNVKVEVLWIVGWLMIWSDRNFPIFWWDLNKEPSGRHREQRALPVPASYWCTWTLASLYLFVFWAAGQATVQTWGQSWCFCWLTEGSDRLAYFLLSSLRCKNFNLTWRTLKSCSVKTSRCLPWV